MSRMGEIKTGEIITVPMEKIEPIPVALRVMLESEKQLLRKSIKELGYVELIQVVYYSDRDKYRIVNGQHRYEVLREAGVEEIQVVVLGRDWSEEKYWTEALRLNNIRGDYDLNVLADIVQKLRKSYGNMLESEFAAALGWTPMSATFKRALKKVIGELPADVKKKVKDEVEKKKIVNLDDLYSVLEKASRLDKFRAIIFTHGPLQALVVALSPEEWAVLTAFRAKYGDEELVGRIVSCLQT